LHVEDNTIMFTDLNLMDPEQRDWFDKKQAIIRQSDA
jgi:hypothetical protein